MQQLFQEHDQIREIGAKLWAIVKQPEPAQTEELAQLRVALSRILMAHFQNEDICLAASAGDQALSEQLSSWVNKRDELRMRYSEHLQAWSLTNVIQNWATYRAAVSSHLQAAEAHMRLEEEVIYPGVLKITKVV